jgi:hypothetical protein
MFANIFFRPTSRPENHAGDVSGESRIWRKPMVDRYTKCVLTVIAAALVALLAQNAITSGRAGPLDVVKVQICGSSGLNCVDLSPTTNRTLGTTLHGWALPVRTGD